MSLALLFCPLLPVPVAMPNMPTAEEMRADLPEVFHSLSAFAAEGDDFVEEASIATPAEALSKPVYIHDSGRSVMASRGGRVSPQPLAAVQPKFAAGRMVDPAGLLRRGIAFGDEEMRTALAGPLPTGETLVASANFRRPADTSEILSGPVAETETQVAVFGPAAVKSALVTASEPSSLAAYAAPAANGISDLFDAVLRGDRGFVPPLGENDHSWAATQLPPSSYTAKEQTCLATGIYFEARGETDQGQAAVAQVILNRVRNPAYPKTICGVVYQNQDWRNRCQFSFACDGIRDVIWNKPAYAKAERIAQDVTNGEIWLPEVGSATHYHATYVHPRWAKTMKKVDKIGLHVFYRTFGGGWR